MAHMNIHEFFRENKNELTKFEDIIPLEKRVERVAAIFDPIKADCQGNQILEDQYERVVENCYRYLATVCEYERFFQDHNSSQFDREDFQEKLSAIDLHRSLVHNSTIDSFNVLSRLMVKNGKNNSWIKLLVEGGRSAYGNLAMNKTFFDILEMKKREKEKGDQYGQ